MGGCSNGKQSREPSIKKEQEKFNRTVKKKENFNVILITIDTLRYDRVSIYSPGFAQTPNIDEIARKSIIFYSAYAHNPLTLPSHANILTGTYPLYHGIVDNTGFKLDEKFLTIAELLKENKFRTAAFIGAFPLDSRFCLNQGFDLYDDNYGTQSELHFLYIERPAEKVIKPAMEWISAQQGKWFAWIHLFDPHQPYSPPSPYKEKYESDLYSGEAAYLDSQLGVLFQFLRKNDSLEDTIVIITSDHGEALGEKGEKTHGYYAYNNTIHVPLIVYIPGVHSKKIEENVGHIDIFPTLCDLLGISIPTHVQGKSLVPLIEGKNWKKNNIYFESLSPNLNMGWAPLRGMIKGNIKFIDLPIPEIYDLGKDPEESNNLAKEYEIDKLKSTLKKIMKKKEGEFKTSRSKNIDRETIKKMESLGYLTGSKPGQTKKQYTDKDDLKKLLPIYNKSLEAIGFFSNGDTKTGIKMLKEVIHRQPSYIMAYKNLAVIYKEGGKIYDAISILEEGLRKNPGSIMLLSRLGLLLTRSGDNKRAIEILEKCIQIEDFNPDYYNHLGIAYYNEKNLKKALENYDISIKLDHNNASAYLNRGVLFLTIDYIKKDGKAIPNAIYNFEKALEFEPKLVKTYLLLATVYKRNKEINKAIDCLEKGLEIKRDDASLLAELGIAYLDKGDNNRALEYFHKIKSLYFSRMSGKNREQLQQLIDEAKKGN